MRAYGGAAAECLRLADRVALVELARVAVHVAFEDMATAHHLLAAFARDASAPPATRWHWLEAAHVLGQTTLTLHWRSHTAMLRYALQLRDLR